MKEIGGYFELELSGTRAGLLHKGALRLNTACNCLEYVIRANRINKLILPFYTCDVLLEPVKHLGIEYQFYQIGSDLEPHDIPSLRKGDAFLYTNYFGIKGNYVAKLASLVGDNLVIDSSQALFEKPVSRVPTFYSLRKFVGIADGALLYPSTYLDDNIPFADSSGRVAHLYKRKDVSASAGYELFRKNDESLKELPLQRMSASTETFFREYDFEANRRIRDRNFSYVHERLRGYNELEVNAPNISGAMCYPLLTSRRGIKEKLHKKKIYIPTYWSNVLEWVQQSNSFEEKLVSCLLPLPIDQRLEVEDLDFMLNCLFDEL